MFSINYCLITSDAPAMLPKHNVPNGPVQRYHHHLALLVKSSLPPASQVNAETLRLHISHRITRMKASLQKLLADG